MARLEFETLAELDQHLKTNTNLSRAVFQNLDLRGYGEIMRAAQLSGAVFLGCRFEDNLLPALIDAGAAVFPRIIGVPYNPYRAHLYSPEELIGGYLPGDETSYRLTSDGRIYDHYQATGGVEPVDAFEALARRLHDFSITNALRDLIKGKRVIAIMGGHSMRRDDPFYLEIALLSRQLTRGGFLMTSGGGPGAMEATHLGAWFAERRADELKAAVAILATAPAYMTKGEWLDAAFDVVRRYPLSSSSCSHSLGIPTWLYGHEPPTYFANNIAKYFANSVREEGLLGIAKNGVIYAPGSAGTIQEIFQDVAQNHYETYGVISPMIFFGKDFWNRQKPVYPLLSQLAAGSPYEKLLFISDSATEIVRQLESFEP